jgi:hypothetical protein
MSQFVELIKDYTSPLVKNFIGAAIILSGILGAYSLWVDNIDFTVPTWLWWVIFFASLFYGQFRAYYIVRKERDELRTFNITQESLKKAATYRQELVTLQNEEIAGETELGTWIQRYDDKRREIVDFLEKNFSPAEASLFERLGNFQIITLGGELNVEHLKRKSRIVRDYEWLENLTIDYGRKKVNRDETD